VWQQRHAASTKAGVKLGGTQEQHREEPASATKQLVHQKM
jgi:hypothetical protein